MVIEERVFAPVVIKP